jgi:hypothetical protein
MFNGTPTHSLHPLTEIVGKLTSSPIYMIWHEMRLHDAEHIWLRKLVAAEPGGTAKR